MYCCYYYYYYLLLLLLLILLSTQSFIEKQNKLETVLITEKCSSVESIDIVSGEWCKSTPISNCIETLSANRNSLEEADSFSWVTGNSGTTAAQL
jgi:hypothetical protein